MRRTIQILLLTTGFTAGNLWAETPAPYAYEEPIAAVQSMAPGWNLGNTLEGVPDEGSWGNPPVEAYTFDDIKASGFRSVRIPVNFFGHIGTAPDYKIDPAFLARTERVVDMALARDLYVLLDFHHFWLAFDKIKTEAPMEMDRFDRIWAQIADRFKFKSSHLLFETINEPDGTVEQANEINLRILKVIRASGGYNDRRIVVLPVHWTNTEQAGTLILPKDDRNVAITVHWYTPWSFVSGEQLEWGSYDEKDFMDSQFFSLKSRFVSKGIPVIIGEYGGSGSILRYYNNLFIDTLNRLATENGLCTMLWDNGALLDRSKHVWRDPGLPEIITKAVKLVPNSFLETCNLFIKRGKAPDDQTIKLQLNGNTVTGLLLGDKPLVEGTDYRIKKDKLTIYKGALAPYFTSGELGIVGELTVRFSAGAPQRLTLRQYDKPVFGKEDVTITAGTPTNATIAVDVKGNGQPLAVYAWKGDGSAVKGNGNLNFGDFWTDNWANPDSVKYFTFSGQYVMSKFDYDGGVIEFEFASGEKARIRVRCR